MKNQESLQSKTIKVVGMAADHGGHEMKEYLKSMLHQAGVEVIDFGDREFVPEDDYPHFVVPLAQAVAAGQVERGVAICGNGVGACVVANKVNGVRACLIHDPFSACQGVVADNLNLLCLGGLIVGRVLAWELVRRFLSANFSGEERHRRRLEKVSEVEKAHSPDFITANDVSRRSCCFCEVNLPLQIYLIRHGETEWTFSHRYNGVTDVPLTALGEDEVREWGHRFLNVPFTRVLVSPYQRTRRTCELVGLADIAELDEDLAEWNYGDYEGMRAVEIREQRPIWNVYRDGCPNGESPAEIAARADRLIRRLQTLSGHVALFSHGQFSSVLAARWLMMPVLFARHLPLGSASLGILKNDPHDPEVPVIELWNSTPHEANRQLTAVPKPDLTTVLQAIQQWDNDGGGIPDALPTRHE